MFAKHLGTQRRANLIAASKNNSAAISLRRAANAVIEGLERRTLLSTVAQWPFNESSGTTAADASGNGHTATLVGGASFATGHSGNALTLNGSNEYADAGSALINTSQSYTVQAWAKWNGSSGYRTILSQDGTPTSAFFLQERGDNGHLSFVTQTTDQVGSSQARVDSVGAAVANRWYYITGVYDAAASQIRLYVDGQLQGEAPFTSSWSAVGNTLIGAGKSQGAHTDFFTGQIDDASVQSGVLSPAQIAAAAGLPSTALPAPFVSTNIGAPAIAGSATYEPSSDTYALSGNGADIWGTSDQFQFVSQPLAGDGAIVARITSTTRVNGNESLNAKSGIMFRASTDANAPFVDLVCTAHLGVQLLYRDNPNDAAGQEGANVGLYQPFWLMLVRRGANFTGYYATTTGTPSASDWIAVGSHVAIGLHNAPAQVGLVACSADPGLVGTAVFANVSVTAGLPSGIAGVAPQRVSAEVLSGSVAVVRWLDNSAIAATGYNVLASTDGGSTFSIVGTAAAGATSLLLSNLSSQTAYTFAVVALYGDGGTSTRSGSVAASTGAASSKQYYAVQLGNNGAITAGSGIYTTTGTAALANPSSNGSGASEWVIAESRAEAIYRAINLNAHVNDTGIDYALANSGAFKVTAVSGDTMRINLEDQYQWAGSDLDYNDDYWEATATASGPVGPGTDNGYQASFKFDSDGAAAVPGYITDIGGLYHLGSSGYTFGWVDPTTDQPTNNTVSTFDTSAASPSLTDSGIYTYKASAPLSWEAAVPNGQYYVTLVAGNPSTVSGTYKYNVEGVTNFLSGTASAGAGRWITKSGYVNVTDGKLTVSNGTGATDHALAYIEITDAAAQYSPLIAAPTGVAATAVSPTAVDIRWKDESDNETSFTIERSTSLSGSWAVIGSTYANAGLFTDDGAVAGTTYYYRVTAAKSGSGSSPVVSSAITTPSSGSTQFPYNPARAAWDTDTRIEAEDFDAGGENISYDDKTQGNAGGFYRSGDFDEGYNHLDDHYFVGWTRPGEWMEYTINVPASGTYVLDASVAAQELGGKFSISVNGIDIDNGIQIPATGSFLTYQQISSQSLQLTAGSNQVLRLTATADGSTGYYVGDVDWIKLRRVDAPTSTGPYFTSAPKTSYTLAQPIGTPNGTVSPTPISAWLDQDETQDVTIDAKAPERPAAATTNGYTPPAGVSGQLTVIPDAKKTDLVQALVGKGGTGINITSADLSYNVASQGTFSTGVFVNEGPTYDLPNYGIVISSGAAGDYGSGPNNDDRHTTDFGTNATAEQDTLLQPLADGSFHDVTELDVNFNVLPGYNTLYFNVVFGSEEFPDFIQSFNDAFGLYLTEPGKSPKNIAFQNGFGPPDNSPEKKAYPNSTPGEALGPLPINIDHPQFDSVNGTELNGVLTPNGNPLLTFAVPVTPGEQSDKLTFIIADTNDGELDSTAYIGSLGATPPDLQDVNLVTPSSASSSFQNVSGVATKIAPGGTADFDTELKGIGQPESFDELVVEPNTGTLVGSVPVVVNQPYSYQATAVDPSGLPLTYSLLKVPNLPNSLDPTANTSIDANGLLSWKPSAPGRYHFVIQAAEQGGTKTVNQEFWVTVSRLSKKNTIHINSTAPSQATADNLFTYHAHATDSGSDPVSYYLESPPRGMVINPVTGVISWTPEQTQSGTQTVTVIALDASGAQDTQNLTLNVTGISLTDPPAFTSTNITTAVVGRPYDYKLGTYDPDGAQVFYSATSLPTGMTLDGVSGELTWTPSTAQVGPSQVTVVATDTNGNSATRFFTIKTYVPPATPQGLTVSSAGSTALSASWNPVSNASLIGYNVYVSNSNTSDYSLVNQNGVIVDPSAVIGGLDPATTYYFKVASVAQESDGTLIESDQSDVAYAATASTPQGPTILTASATPSETSDVHTELQADAVDYDDSSADITYNWSVNSPSGAAAPEFSDNDDDTANDIDAVFHAAGTYVFTVTAEDENGSVISDQIPVTVDQVASGVTVSPPVSNVPAGGTQQFSATVLDQFGNALLTQPAVQWTVDGGGTINPDTGLFTAASNGAGNYVVSAGVASGPSGTANVTVSATGPSITSVSPDPDPVTGTNATLIGIATNREGSASGLTYTWSLLNGAGAVEFGSNNGQSVATTLPVTFHAAGDYLFNLVVTDAQGKSAEQSLSVHVTQTLRTLSVSPVATQAAPGGTQAFTATELDQFGQLMQTPVSVSWSLSTNGSGGQIDSNTGHYQAGSTDDSTDSVVATAGGLTTTASVNVSSQSASPIQVNSITPSGQTPTALAVNVAASDPADPSGEAGLSYTWSTISVPAGATGPTFSANNSNSAKNTQITFSHAGGYQLNLHLSDSPGNTLDVPWSVTVLAASTTVNIIPTSPQLQPGGTTTFSATVDDQFGNPIASPSLKWSIVSSPVKGMIDPTTGVYTASTLSGSYTEIIGAISGGAYATADVSVQNIGPSITSVSSDPDPVTGTNATLKAVATNRQGSSSGLTYTWSWLSGPAAVDFGSNNGQSIASTLPVTFHAAGDYLFDLVVTDAQGKAAQESLSVHVAQTLNTLSVSPVATQVAPNGTQDFTATELDQFGQPMQTPTGVTWSLPTNGSGGQIDSSTGVYQAGSTDDSTDSVVATAGGLTATASVNVSSQSASPIQVNSITPSGETATQLTLSVDASEGGGISGPPPILSYLWSAVSAPSGSAGPTFSPNNGSTANDTQITFTAAGSYELNLHISDSLGNSLDVPVPVTVPALATAITNITSNSPQLQPGGTTTFSATVDDQFGNPIASPSLKWSIVSSPVKGTIDPDTGVYTAAASSGSYAEVIGVISGGAYATLDVSVQTASALPVPSHFSAVAVSTTQIELTWDSVAGASDYLITRTGGGPSIQYETSADPDYDQELTPGTTYTYTVQALDGNGNPGAVSLHSVTNTWTVPAKPTGVTATVLSGTQIALTWDDGKAIDSQISGWDILRATSTDNAVPLQSAFTSIVTADGQPNAVDPVNRESDEGLSPDTHYWYEIVAMKHTGGSESSPPSDPIEATTGHYPGVPTAPTNVAAAYAGDGRVGVTWDSVQSSALLGYDIYRGTRQDFVPSASTFIQNTSNTYITDDGVAAGQYYYKIVAVNDANLGNGTEVDSPPSQSAFVDTSIAPATPNAPSNLQSSGIQGNSVDLTWKDNSVGEAGFEIRRRNPNAADPNGDADDWTVVGRVTQNATSFTDNTVEGSADYEYEVAAYSIVSDGPPLQILSAHSNVIQVHTPDIGVAPGDPGTISLVSKSFDQVQISWAAPTNTSGLAGYNVYRQDSTGSWTLLNDSPVDDTSYTDATATPSTSYVYKVRAITTQNHPSSDANAPTLAVTTDSAPNLAPVVNISKLDPTPESDVENGPTVIKSLTHIYGTVADLNGDLSGWTLSLHPINVGSQTPVADIPLTSGQAAVGTTTADGQSAGSEGLLFALDPSRFPAGTYQVILSATDATGHQVEFKDRGGQLPTLTLDSAIQLGNFKLPVTDMTVNVPGGQPIVIRRIYDSSQANVKSNLGYGWRFDISDAGLRTTVDQSSTANDPTVGSHPKYAAYSDGDLVYVTLPGGDQQVFQFIAKPETDPNDPNSGFINGIETYSPQFIAVDGSGAQLNVATTIDGGSDPQMQAYDGSDIALQRDPSTGQYVDYYTGRNYNPQNSLFGGSFSLKTADDTNYSIDANTGQITQSVDANGNVTNYGGGASSNGQSVSLHDDNGDGLVDRVTGPGGRTVYYRHDAAGNLVGVTEPQDANPTDTYGYTYDASHRLTGVKDGRGVTTISATYDPDSGDLTALTDPTHQTATVDSGASSGDRSGQVVTDLDGNTTETIYDSHGNPTRVIQTVTEGGTTSYIVTCHSYTYGTFNYNLAEEFGLSNENGLQGQIDFQPFKVSGDNANARYTQQPTAVSQETTYYSVDPTDPQHWPAGDLFKVQDVSTARADGTMAVTHFANYVNGKPGDVTDPYGNVTHNVYDPNSGTLLSSTTEYGTSKAQTTYYTYTGDGDNTPKGLLLRTYRVRSGGDPADPGDQITLSQNAYYTYADVQNSVAGAFAGQVKSTIDAAGQTTYYAYDGDGNTVLTYVPKTWVSNGGTTFHGWTADITRYDFADRTTDTWRATYLGTGSLNFAIAGSADSPGVVSVSDPLYDDASQSQASPSATALHDSHTEYGATGAVSSTQDQYQRTTTNHYDIKGNLIETLSADGTVVRTVYDAMGRAVLTTDPFVPGQSDPVLGTRSIYDSLGRVIETDRVSGVDISVASDTRYTDVYAATVNSEGTQFSSTKTFFTPQGWVDHTIGTDGQRTNYTYYPNGQQHTVTTAVGTADEATTTYAYDQTTGTLPDGAVSYDSVEDADHHVTKTYKDALGRSVETLYDDGSFTQTLYGVGDAAVPSYSAFVIPPGGSETVSIGQRKAGDPEVATVRVYDKAGRLTDVYLPAVTDGDPTSATYGQSERPHWSYAYDTSGNEVSQTDPKGNVTTFTYDANGNQLSRTLPGGQTEYYTYDAYGRVATHTDFDRNVATYTYEPNGGTKAGLVQSIVYTDASGVTTKPAQTVAYTYDDLNRQQTVADQSGTTTYHYDDQGNVSEEETPEGNIHYVYDPATGRHIETYTDNTDTLYHYDDAGRLDTVTLTKLNGVTLTTPLVTHYTYDAAGNKETETLPDGEVTTYGYDDLNRLTSVSEVQGTTSVFSQTYILNDDGTRKSSDESQLQADNSTTVSWHTDWTYDGDGRLTSEVVTSSGTPGRDYSDAFGYDLAGNRVNDTHDEAGTASDDATTYAYNSDDELTKQVSTLSGETDFTYDANGSERTSTNGTSVTTNGYGVRNKMESVTTPTTASIYIYDDAGNRVEEQVTHGTATTTTLYLTDNANPTGYAQPIEEKASINAAPTITYLIGDRVYGQANASGAVSYLLTDGHGSTQALTSAIGAITQDYAYTAFGGAVGFDADSAGTTFLFGGDAVYDPASGLYLHGDGTRGRIDFRFIEADEYGYGNDEYPLSLNAYSYAQNNSINGNDLSGHFFSNFTYGNQVDDEIGLDFTKSPGRYHDTAISVILGFKVPLVGRLRPDLVDTKTSEVYEIKPLGPEAVEGGIKISGYIGILRGFDPLKRSWHRGSTYIPPAYIQLDSLAFAIVFPPVAGVIQYEVINFRELVGLTLGYAIAQTAIDLGIGTSLGTLAFI